MTAERAWQRLHELASASDDRTCLTRRFFGDGMTHAADLLAGWMEEAGMRVERDAWGNLFGCAYPENDSRPLVVIGSHYDTVQNAGTYDGALGILAGLAAIEIIVAKDLPCRLELAAFSDEEGLRFQTTYLGSRAAIGEIQESDLQRKDTDAIRLGDLIPINEHYPKPRYVKGSVAAYLEIHIEQGPVLEKENLPLGVVDAIAGQSRVKINLIGSAAHAGTCPMTLRKDALTGSAEWILAVETHARETPGLVATVGCLTLPHAASNVVPGMTEMTLDLRHANNEVRTSSQNFIEHSLKSIASARGLIAKWEVIQESPAVPSCKEVMAHLIHTLKPHQSHVPVLTSGAGHDAAIMARVAPMGMLMVRCKNGVSHHPDESVTKEDFFKAVDALVSALSNGEGLI